MKLHDTVRGRAHFFVRDHAREKELGNTYDSSRSCLWVLLVERATEEAEYDVGLGALPVGQSALCLHREARERTPKPRSSPKLMPWRTRRSNSVCKTLICKSPSVASL